MTNCLGQPEFSDWKDADGEKLGKPILLLPNNQPVWGQSATADRTLQLTNAGLDGDQ